MWLVAAGGGLEATGECEWAMVTIGGKLSKCWKELKVGCDEAQLLTGDI